MKKILFIGFALLIFCASCQQRKAVSAFEVIRTEAKQNVDKEIDLHQVMQKIEAINLSADSTFMLGHLKDVVQIDSLLFLLDDATSTIWTVSLNSKRIVNHICRRGNGPQEFIHPVAMSAWEERLYVLDLPTRKVIVFDKNLSPLEDFMLPFAAIDLAACSEGLLFCNLTPDNNYQNIIRTDFHGTNPENLFLSEKEIGFVTSGQKNFVKGTDGSVYATLPKGNEVYLCNQEGFTQAYQIDFQDASLPDGYDRKNQNIMEEEDYAVNTNVFVLRDTFVNSFFYKNKRYYTFTSLKDMTQKTGIVRGEDTDWPFFPQWQAGECLIGYCNQEENDFLLLFYLK